MNRLIVAGTLCMSALIVDAAWAGANCKAYPKADWTSEADAKTKGRDRNDADIELRPLEAHLQGQPVNPVVLAGTAERRRASGAGVEDRAH